MRIRIGIGLVALALATPPVGCAANASTAAPTPQTVVPGVWLIPGGIRAGREPDGNSVIFAAPAGLIVVDTGRHEWHRRAILSLARSQAQPIVAIVNSHWHLDHVSGNPTLRAAFPQLRVYASNAIDHALTGFLAASATEQAGYPDDPQFPEELREDIRGDLLAIRNGAALKPDVVITGSGPMTLGGRVLTVNLAPDAATAGDIWLYDTTSRVVVLGDLVTLPAPFLDTACPDGWQAALAQVAATPFRIAIPGHGAPMTRAQFSLYRQAFSAFIHCADSSHSGTECATDWVSAIRSLLAADPPEEQQAQGTAAYYVDMLRTHGGRSKYCEEPRGTG